MFPHPGPFNISEENLSKKKKFLESILDALTPQKVLGNMRVIPDFPYTDTEPEKDLC
jgi:hypothetical protein